MVARSNPGTSMSLTTAAASTRPNAARSGTVSASSVRSCPSSQDKASCTVCRREKPCIRTSCEVTLLPSGLHRLREQGSSAEAHFLRRLAAGGHLHGAVLELRDLAERVEHGIGQLVGRGFVVAERD